MTGVAITSQAEGGAISRSSVPASRRRRIARRRLWPFLLPSGILCTLVLVYPLAYAFKLSLYHTYLDSGTSRFAGLANYTDLLQDSRFWQAMIRTIWIVACSVGLEFGLGLLVAYGLYCLTRGARAFTVLMLLPLVVTPVVAALFLKWLLAPRWGLISAALISLNIFPPDFLGNPVWACISVILADTWQFTPFIILVLYAGLQTVEQSQIEAAQLDGAGRATLLFRIMLPSIRPLIVFVLAIRIMDAFRNFDTIYVLTGGGPGSATETITMYTYALGFRLLEIGKAAALGVITLLVISVATGLVIAALRERGAVRS